MSHRIREAMRQGEFAVPFGVDGGAVEVDGTYIGRDKTIKPDHEKRGRAFHHKHGPALPDTPELAAINKLMAILHENAPCIG